MTDLLHEIYYRLPTVVQDAVLIHRRTPIWLKAGVLFVHIPRAAGTSINQALYGQFMGHPRAKNIRRWGSSRLNALPSFAVTRNPWGRLVSAWRFARRGSGVDGSVQARIRHPERYHLPAFDRFDTFVLDWLVHQDRKKLDAVFQPQSNFVCDKSGNVLVDHVGRLEAIEATWDFLRRHLASVPKLEHSNRSGEDVDYRPFYTPALVDVVGRFYDGDVSRFGYRFDDG